MLWLMLPMTCLTLNRMHKKLIFWRETCIKNLSDFSWNCTFSIQLFLKVESNFYASVKRKTFPGHHRCVLLWCCQCCKRFSVVTLDWLLCIFTQFLEQTRLINHSQYVLRRASFLTFFGVKQVFKILWINQ